MELQEKDFPPVETIDPKQLTSTHKDAHVVPHGKADLAFTITLPNNWFADPAAVTPGDGSNWTLLAVFAAKPDANTTPPADVATMQWATVSVLWRRLDAEVALDEWTALQMNAMNAQQCTSRIWSDAAGPVIEVGGTCPGTIDPTTSAATPVQTVMRAMIRASGQNVFMVWGYATPGAYQAVARDLLIAGASFRLDTPRQDGFEPILRAQASSPSFEVAHPASWTHRPQPAEVNIPGKKILDLLLVVDDALKGYVRVKAVDPRIAKVESMDQLTSDAAEELKDTGIQLTHPWSPLTGSSILSIPDLEGAFISGTVIQDFPYELHFGVVQRPPLIFCITAMVTPMQIDPIICLRGRRAYGIALASVTPKE